MRIRRELEKRVEKKREEVSHLEAEIRRLETQVVEAKSYILGIQEALRMLPRDQEEQSLQSDPSKRLRAGTNIAKAFDVLKQAGKPLHITDLLRAIGLPVNKQTRVSLSGSLAAYVRNRDIFSRPAPNTFGLIGMGGNGALVESEDDEVPEEFGETGSEIEEKDIPF